MIKAAFSFLYVLLTLYVLPLGLYIALPTNTYIYFFWAVYASLIFTNLLICTEIGALVYGRTVARTEERNYESFCETLMSRVSPENCTSVLLPVMLPPPPLLPFTTPEVANVYARRQEILASLSGPPGFPLQTVLICPSFLTGTSLLVFNDFMATPIAIVISAYLDNEITVLPATIANFENCVLPRGTEIIVSYNTKSFNAENHSVIQDACGRSACGAKFTILYNEASKSKAENINSACDYLKTRAVLPEIVALYDADNQPDKFSIIYAVYAMATNRQIDVLQGRLYIRKPSVFIAIEYNLMYCLFHEGGSYMRGYGIFGGTNGYWKFGLLDRVRFKPTKLTEDIDATFRAIVREGASVAFDRNVTNSEEAPPTIAALIRQRLRWSGGWAQVSANNIFRSLASRNLSARKKIFCFLLFFWREIYTYISAHLLAILAASVIKCTTTPVWWGEHGDIACLPLAYYTPTLLIVIVPMIYVMILFLMIEEVALRSDLRAWHYAAYALVSPFYEIFKNHICVYSHSQLLVGSAKWNVTPRN